VIEDWSKEQLDAFERDGFLVVEKGFIDDAVVGALRERFDPLFAGDYETGIRPDEVNWVAGRDPEDRTRQICNGWKADPRIAAQVLSERTGRLAAELIGWDRVRLLQDNCIWKPPGTKSLGMHQDGSYLDYLVPPEMITCWIALDHTAAEAGTITMRPARTAGRVPRRIAVSSTRRMTGLLRSTAPFPKVKRFASCRSR
jgi:ectoine hydroxylase-related dioxygenase (phytanoyl-CoA dioxygenase family)